MQKIDKIYFDVDGVLRGTASPKEDIIALLRYCLDNYGDSLYWLTTHCKYGVNHAPEALRGELPDDLVNELKDKVHPTDWENLKTEAIDLDSDFIWFDDNLFESEKQILATNYVLDGFFPMDFRDPKMARKALNFLQQFNLDQSS
ncbi:hypothetical protein IJG89_03825 [Candidatus Saccharibacteria bacterium]|nr:hypothetical protein [Candidatus Saccharibacteria bacterium]